jgi:hypothetical protein
VSSWLVSRSKQTRTANFELDREAMSIARAEKYPTNY